MYRLHTLHVYRVVKKHKFIFELFSGKIQKYQYLWQINKGGLHDRQKEKNKEMSTNKPINSIFSHLTRKNTKIQIFMADLRGGGGLSVQQTVQ